MSAPTTIATGVVYGPVTAEPYSWPFDGGFRPERTALINIDWQVDFCGIGGYVDRMGYDLNLTRAGLGPTQKVLAAAREAGLYIVHTREGHRPDLADCPPMPQKSTCQSMLMSAVRSGRNPPSNGQA